MSDTLRPDQFRALCDGPIDALQPSLAPVLRSWGPRPEVLDGIRVLISRGVMNDLASGVAAACVEVLTHGAEGLARAFEMWGGDEDVFDDEHPWGLYFLYFCRDNALEAAPRLIEELDDARPYRRQRALAMLGFLWFCPLDRDAIERRLGDVSGAVRRAALSCLEKLRGMSREALTRGLEDDDANVKACALSVLFGGCRQAGRGDAPIHDDCEQLVGNVLHSIPSTEIGAFISTVCPFEWDCPHAVEPLVKVFCRADIGGARAGIWFVLSYAASRQGTSIRALLLDRLAEAPRNELRGLVRNLRAEGCSDVGLRLVETLRRVLTPEFDDDVPLRQEVAAAVGALADERALVALEALLPGDDNGLVQGALRRIRDRVVTQPPAEGTVVVRERFEGRELRIDRSKQVLSLSVNAATRDRMRESLARRVLEPIEAGGCCPAPRLH